MMTRERYLQIHKSDTPLKYCISKDHIIFTNPQTIPELDGRDVPSDEARGKYYSFINLKLIDTQNYDYTFKRFYLSNTDVEQYTYITDIELLIASRFG